MDRSVHSLTNMEERLRHVSIGNVPSGRDGFYTRHVKVAIDVSVSAIALIILFPLMLLLWIWIRLDSSGPGLFKQRRIGKGGREFTIYKFRTMRTDAPSQAVSPNSSSDPRITRFGRVLRKTSLDELPQLFNIVKGEMSFIGPRPEQKFIVEKYYTSYERERFTVKPGLTGYWQVSADRKKPIHENLQHDFRYIEEMSLGTDLKILIGTLKVMFSSNTC